ncbi:hypothetical protein FHR55_000705 [Xanthomonas arboricola]
MNDIEQRACAVQAAMNHKVGGITPAKYLHLNEAQWAEVVDAIIAALSREQAGYIDAFYEVAEMLGIGARVRIPGTDEGSPKHVWETEMRPMLMAALRRQEEERVYHAALQRIGYALGLPVGSDLTTQCIPAIEAMHRDAGRWQFVRAGSPATIRLDGRMQPHGITGLVPHYFHGRDEQELDASIDAGMLAAKPELMA